MSMSKSATMAAWALRRIAMGETVWWVGTDADPLELGPDTENPRELMSLSDRQLAILDDLSQHETSEIARRLMAAD